MDYSGKAYSKWKLSQKIVRAMPGTPAGKKVALKERINRADLAVLFAEELKIGVLFDRMLSKVQDFKHHLKQIKLQL